MIRLINITLAILTIFGAITAFRDSSRHRELLERHRALAAQSGYLEVSDSSKVHVVALPSEDPLHFRWRIYLPDKCTVVWKTNQWWGGSGSSTGPQDFIAQVRIRKNDNGFVRVFKDLEAHGAVGSLGGRELQDFMRDRWDDIEILQLGSDGPAAVEPDELATLLRLQFPKDTADDVAAVLATRGARQWLPVLYQVQFGTNEAWQKAERGNSARGESKR